MLRDLCTTYQKVSLETVKRITTESFLSLNGITDGIMRKDTHGATLTDPERERNRQLAKKRYIVEQYIGLSYLYDGAYRAGFTTMAKKYLGYPL
jgi:hypothetical protein